MRFDLQGCQVRSWKRSDAAAIVRHANDRDVWIQLRDRFPHPYTIANAHRWLDEVCGAEPEVQFAIAVAGRAVGGIGFAFRPDVYRRSAEIGYWLGREHWGRGIMTQAVVAVSAYALKSFDLVRLDAEVFETNPASRRVLEKAGYVCEGCLQRSVTKAGRTIDAFRYALLRPE